MIPGNMLSFFRHWLTPEIFLLPLLLILSGCTHTPQSLRSTVDFWSRMGMYLPDEATIAHFAARTPSSLEALRYGLQHSDGAVRMRAAYVAGNLGAKAAPLAPDLRAAYQAEQEAINRVYAMKALAAIGDRSEATRQFLASAFDSESDGQVRTYAAGAILLTGADREREAWAWIRASLVTHQPPSNPVSQEGNAYWERRWAASCVLGMLKRTAAPLLPPLRQLGTDPATPEWVKERVREDLAAIENSANQQAQTGERR